jgi:hypothetical protein
LISDSSRSVEICSFVVVVASVSSVLCDPIATVLICFCSNSAVCGGFGLFGSKGPFMSVVLSQGALVRQSVRVGGSIYSPVLTSTNTYASLFLLFNFTPIRGSLSSVDVSVFAFFFLLGLVLNPPEIGIKCFIFNDYFLCGKLVKLMSPQFLCIIFYFSLIYLGYGRGFPMLSFCLRKKKSSTYFHAHVR